MEETKGVTGVKRKRKNRKRLVINSDFPTFAQIEIDDQELVEPIEGNDLTRIRAGVLCAETPRIFEMMILRMFCYPPHLKRVLTLWNTMTVVEFCQFNAAVNVEQTVGFLMRSQWLPVLEISSRGFLFHPFGTGEQHKRFMLEMIGFGPVITQMFSALFSAAEGSPYQHEVTNATFLRYDYVMEGAEALWRSLRTYVCACFLGKFVEDAPAEKRDRVVEQLTECVHVLGFAELEEMVSGFATTEPADFQADFVEKNIL